MYATQQVRKGLVRFNILPIHGGGAATASLYSYQWRVDSIELMPEEL